MEYAEFHQQQTIVLQRQAQQLRPFDQEIYMAKAALERYGYEVALTDNGQLIVQDPVRTSASGGALTFSHYTPVVIRNYNGARKFINARS